MSQSYFIILCSLWLNAPYVYSWEMINVQSSANLFVEGSGLSTNKDGINL
jgi:hypothetical protein